MSKTQKASTGVRRILLPINRTSYRFLDTINKIRTFFNESSVSCIPCVENPFETLLKTKKIERHNIQTIKIDNKNFKYGVGKRMAIQFKNADGDQMKMLAEHLHTEVIPAKNAVLLPKSISNFMFTNQADKYINSKYSSLEEQRSNMLQAS